MGRTILVLGGSSHAISLRALKNDQFEQLQWQEVDGADTMELLERVDSGEADLAIVDSSEFAVMQGLYARLRVAFELGEEQEVVWFLSPGKDNARLLQHIDEFFVRLNKDGTMERIRDKHFGHTASVTPVGSHTFTRNMRDLLPTYRDLIQQVATEFTLDWRLLAAIAYQESHWNPRAASPTGVRGMMMLTLPTAREMGIEDRLDPMQSLRGGARYLKNMKRRLPEDIAEPDLTWFALAAYNIGLGHLEDARVITQLRGGNPHLWVDVMDHLPLLQKRTHYANTRHGYARGAESVTYVQNIRHYYSILRWQEIPRNHSLSPIQTGKLLPAIIRNSGFLAL